MGRGRPRKLTNDKTIETSKLTKAEISQRKAEEAQLEKFEKIQENPPHYLSYLAKQEWKRIIPLMKDLPVANLDLTMIASYCQLYSHYRQLNNDLNKNGQVLIYTDDDGNETSRRANPSFNMMMNTAKELRAICGQLGMSINSRLQMVNPDEETEEDEFLKLLKS